MGTKIKFYTFFCRKVACEELSLECTSCPGHIASDLDHSPKTLLSENQGHKNVAQKERENVSHRPHHSSNNGRGCSKKG